MYAQHVEQHQENFQKSCLLKSAKDLANILDNPIFTIDPENARDNSWFAEDRESVFNDFCTLCARVGVPIPRLEPELYRAHLPKDGGEKNIDRMNSHRNHVFSQLKGDRSRNASLCRTLARTLGVFPECAGYESINEKNLIAVINSSLIEIGLDPIRPSYIERKIKLQNEAEGPHDKTMTLGVLIVDDDRREILNTAHALVGWPGIDVDFLYYQCEDSWNADKEVELDQLSKSVVGHYPDIVLMDQGLPPVEGSDVIKRIKQTKTDHPIFVANTGGSDEDLEKAGAFENCRKGDNFNGFREAIHCFN